MARAASFGGFQAIGDLPLHDTDRVVADSHSGRLVVVGGGGVNVGDVYLRVTLYDTRGPTRIASVEYPPYLPQVARIGTSPEVFAFDEAHRLLYVLVYRNRADQENTANPNLLTVNVDTLRIVSGPAALSIFPRGIRIFGARVWGRGRIGLVGQLIPAASAPETGEVSGPQMFGVVVGEVDGKTAHATWGPTIVRGCQTVISNQDQAAVVLRRGSVYVGCGTGTVGTATAPGTPAVVAIDRTTSTSQRLNVLPGSYAGGDSYFDPVAERLLLVGRAGDRPAQAVWVFDLAHEVFLGEIAAGDFVIRGFGVDPQVGRLYISIGRIAEPGQLLVSSDLGVDIPQALSFGVPTATGPIVAIPFTHSVIVPVEVRDQKVVYRVFRDSVPATAFSVSSVFDYSSYDSLAADSPQYTGDVQAFGVRLHDVGGFGGIAKNAFYLDGANYWPFAPTGLKDGDRDLYLARVVAAHLSQDEASAAAIQVDRDDTTDSDYRTLAARSHKGLPEQWPFQRAECRDFGDGAKPGTAQGASSHCGEKAGTLDANATYAGAGLSGLISIGSASSTANIHIDPKLGLVAEATAEARQIEIAGVVRIERITSTVTVAAKGEAGTATVHYARSIEGVTAGGFTCTTQCDPFAVVRAIAAALGAQFRVELPEADVLATKGGSHAHVLREAWGHQQDVVLSSQDPTELQVPAMRLIYTGDNAVAARLIIEFAGAMGDSTFLRVAPGSGTQGGGTVVPPLVRPSVLPTTIARPVERSTGGHESIIRRIVRGFRHGWHVAFGMGPRSAALWMILILPAFLFVRRRQLMSLVRGAH